MKRKQYLIWCLDMARAALTHNTLPFQRVAVARLWLNDYRVAYAATPERTRRRWRRGK